MNRFFRESNDKDGSIIKVYGEDFHHIKNVLRLKIENEIEIVINEILYLSIIKEISKDFIIAYVKEEKKIKKDKLKIHLYQCLTKSDKFDYIVQKSVELGVNCITPVISKRVIIKLKDKSLENKIQRYQKISKQAASQSHRYIIPKVNYPVKIENIDLRNDELGLVAFEGADNMNLKSILKENSLNNIKIIIGPEGGFEDLEIDILKNKGFEIISLGKQILRTETAPINLISILNYELGDFI